MTQKVGNTRCGTNQRPQNIFANVHGIFTRQPCAEAYLLHCFILDRSMMSPLCFLDSFTQSLTLCSRRATMHKMSVAQFLRLTISLSQFRSVRRVVFLFSSQIRCYLLVLYVPAIQHFQFAQRTINVAIATAD